MKEADDPPAPPLKGLELKLPERGPANGLELKLPEPALADGLELKLPELPGLALKLPENGLALPLPVDPRPVAPPEEPPLAGAEVLPPGTWDDLEDYCHEPYHRHH